MCIKLSGQLNQSHVEIQYGIQELDLETTRKEENKINSIERTEIG